MQPEARSRLTRPCLQYIISELDEMDREEFFRLKKVQGKKKQRAEIEEAESKAKAAATGNHDPAVGAGGGGTGGVGQDMLAAGKDEDIIF